MVERHRPELESLPMPSAEGHVLGRDLLVRALDGVTDEQADMVLMTFVWGYGQDRVAELLGTSVRTVGRARARFQEEVDRLTLAEAGLTHMNGRT